MGTQKSQKGRLSAAQEVQEVGHRKSGPATRAKRSAHEGNKPELGKHRVHRSPRPSLVGSRFGDRTDEVVPTPGSPSLGELRRNRRRRAA
jgi:hypothetical protein